MNQEEKEILKKKILSRYEIYKLQGSRFQRLLNDPVRAIPYFIMQYIAYLRPYKVNYRTPWGDKMRFYLPEGGMIYYYDFFEANLSNFFINFLKEGDVFFDVGAHVGYYSMLASNLVGDTGKVISFEPTPRTFQSLSENAHTKNNITTYNNAVLNEETEIEFFDYGPNYSAFNSFKKRTSDDIFFKDKVEEISVKTISLDKFCKEKKLFPALIKIDAEGSEHLILGAMNEILENNRPAVTIEISGDKDFKENSINSINFLTSKGYRCFKITLNGNLQNYTDPEIGHYDNLLFIHPEKLDMVKNLTED